MELDKFYAENVEFLDKAKQKCKAIIFLVLPCRS